MQESDTYLAILDEGQEKASREAIRGFLLLCTIAHVWSAFLLWRIKSEARPQAYVRKATIATSYAARTMLWSGTIIAAFLVYHILHFTTGQALGAEFIKGDVYHNVVAGFSKFVVVPFAEPVADTMPEHLAWLASEILDLQR